MANKNRPLSPHFQIYKWELHMAASILHRATGVALGVGTILFTWWLFAVSSGPTYYSMMTEMMSGAIGRLVLFGFSYALIYHLLNGMRHLRWDMGKGLEKHEVAASGKLMMILSVVITLGIWYLGYAKAGLV
jgi:succinate dehydrogenase / fumarate reductase cytochrome b subunit